MSNPSSVIVGWEQNRNAPVENQQHTVLSKSKLMEIDFQWSNSGTSSKHFPLKWYPIKLR